MSETRKLASFGEPPGQGDRGGEPTQHTWAYVRRALPKGNAEMAAL